MTAWSMDSVRIERAPNGHHYAHMTLRDPQGLIVAKFIDNVTAAVRAAAEEYRTDPRTLPCPHGFMDCSQCGPAAERRFAVSRTALEDYTSEDQP